MKVLVVYAHPNPASFNAGILEQVKSTLTKRGDEVEVRDLYALNFNPVLSGAELGAMFSGQGPFADAKAEQDYISWADALVFIYPIWWIDRPAILKGYIDRVFSHGFAFVYGPQGVTPLLKGKKAFVLQTTGSPHAAYQAWNMVDAYKKTMDEGTLGFVGMETKTETYYGVGFVSQQDREQMLQQLESSLNNFLN